MPPLPEAAASGTLPAHFASLLRPEAYPHPVAAVRLIETHISWVFLTGEFAYKIKRPVQYSFVDLRSSERRAFFCREELRLNRRFAPELYVDVCAVTLDSGVARILGSGEVIDHAVRMHEFRGEEQLERLLLRDALADSELERFGRELANLHERLPVVAEGEDWGRPLSVRGLLMRNLEECLQASEGLGTQETLRALAGGYQALLAAAESCITSRRRAGRVRECHGDLHAGNVVRCGGRLLAFDCIEFEPDFRWIDVAQECAFLFMDLGARGFPRRAQVFLGGYLAQSGDYQACRLLRLYATHCALVRAKVSALQALGATGAAVRADARELHGRYLGCAREMLAPARPRLILTCGLSGSGKTWLAARLADALGAVHVRSDVERQRIGGFGEGLRSDSGLGQGMYSSEMNRKVYERLRQCAADVLAGVYSVIVDATFQRSEERRRMRALASERVVGGVVVVFCHAPDAVLEARVLARREARADASEADLAVLSWQRRAFEPIRPDEQGIRLIDADTTRSDVVSRVLEQIADS